ncbi:MAG: adenylosuccinate lyase, partial [Nitrosomonadales bacterium]|nr:adenylosuccinate lyase [Nitrosomonadales bacterium]
MINRYARKEMTEIWSAATKYKIWFEIESYGCDALAEIGVIPKESAENI